MKKILIAVILIVLMMVITGCTSVPEGRVNNAIIRYFDGSSEMVEIEHYIPNSGFVVLSTVYGQKIRIGWNNVILIEEDEEEQYNNE